MKLPGNIWSEETLADLTLRKAPLTNVNSVYVLPLYFLRMCYNFLKKIIVALLILSWGIIFKRQE